MHLGEGIVIALLAAFGALASGPAIAAASSESSDVIVKRIEKAVAESYWQTKNFYVLTAVPSLKNNSELSALVTRCADYRGEGAQAFRVPCTLEGIAIAKVWTIQLGGVDLASIAVRESVSEHDESGNLVAFSCRDDKPCVTIPFDKPPGNDLLTCKDRQACEQLKADFVTLVSRAPGAGQRPAVPDVPPNQTPRLTPPPRSSTVTPPKQQPAPPQNPGPGQATRTVSAALQRVNSNIQRATYFSGRNLLVTTSLNRMSDGRFELRGHLCTGLTLNSPRNAIEACRASNPTGPDTSVLFSASDIDGGSVHLESNAGTYRVLFLCRDKGPCVARPNKSAHFPGGFIACPDATACNRLVIDLSTLLDFASAR